MLFDILLLFDKSVSTYIDIVHVLAPQNGLQILNTVMLCRDGVQMLGCTDRDAAKNYGKKIFS